MSRRIFGLTIRAAVGLGLDDLEATPRPDVEIALQPPTELEAQEAPLHMRCAGDTLEVRWSAVGLARAASTLLSIRPAPGATPEHIRALAQSSLPLVPFLRGATLLHGSCVRIGDAAVSLVGPSGAGKSTMAAALVDRGHRLVSDGVTVIADWECKPTVLPGVSVQRLWPDALAHLGDDPERHPGVLPGLEKRLRPTVVTDRPIRLGHVYLVETGDHEGAHPLAPAEAAAHVARNTYLGSLLPPELYPQILAQAAALTRQVTTSRLVRRLGLEHLAPLLDVIEATASRPT